MKRRTLVAAALLVASVVGLVPVSPPAGATTVHVTVRDTGAEFDPAAVTVNNGDWVSWTPHPANTLTHNVSSVPPLNIPSSDIPPGGGLSARITRLPAGTYRYYCKYHGSPEGGMGGTITVSEPSPPADFDADGDTDISVYRPSSSSWLINGGTGANFGTTGDIPVPGYYDRDEAMDFAVFRPSLGLWFTQGTVNPVSWGTAGDIPVPADYDGDSDDDIAVFRPSTGTWFVRDGVTTAWGTEGDIPVPGDYDGDGDMDIAVFRPSNGIWFVQGGATVVWGTAGDIPVPGDYNGANPTEMAVFRPSNGIWFVNGGATTPWGTLGDVPLPLPDAIRRFFFPPL